MKHPSLSFTIQVAAWLIAIACACGLAVHVQHLGAYFDAQIRVEREQNAILRAETEVLRLQLIDAVAEVEYLRELSREAETIRVLEAMGDPPSELRAQWKRERPNK